MDWQDQMDLFDEGAAKLRRDIPGFGLRYKNRSWSSKVIAVLVWLFNRHYLTRYTTTRYPKVYFPSRKYVDQKPLFSFKILMHEYVHLFDRRELGWWFSIGYAMPQILGLLLVVVFVVLGFVLTTEQWWWALLVGVPGVVCLAPVPAYWRMKFEMRGYAMNMAIDYWRYGSVQESTKEWVVGQFTGPMYYFMWPFKKGMRKRVERVMACLEDGSLMRPGHGGLFGGSKYPYLAAMKLLEEYDRLEVRR